MSKLFIGRKDFADFPEFGLENIAVKTDTGAYSSSIHCHHIEEIVKDGEKAIQFRLLDPNHEEYNEKLFCTRKYAIKTIKNSFGGTEDRYIITTNIILFGNFYPIKLSLSERGEMKYPVLLGRELLNKNFNVDTDRTNLSFKKKQKSK
ncbi:MAG: RimK/LysX family protein [Lutimonas sp.]|jgi:hypothetical protein